MASNVTPFGPQSALQVVSPAVLEAHLRNQELERARAAQPPEPAVPELVGYIKGQFEIFRNHRNTAAGWSNRMIEALRTFNGQYSATKIQEIKKFGGSEVYARLSAQKCRAASSLLRDIYLGVDRPWAVDHPASVDVPQSVLQKIQMLVQTETQMVAQMMGKPPDPDDLRNRYAALVESAEEAAKKKAKDQADFAEDKIETFLREGGFYDALAEFLVDLPIFPFACVKGPVVKIVPEVRWQDGKPYVQQVPKMTWSRVSPFDLWWTPGVSDISNANVIEKSRLTRAELNDLLDLPGANIDEVRAVLDEYGRGGLYDVWDTTDAERAVLESRENPAWNRSGLITQMEFHGNVQGQVLQEYGMPGIPDPLRDYHIDAYCIGSHVVKANLSLSPRARHPYFITSYEKVPGTPIGNGLIDMIADLQDVANATLRSMVNNLSISSGPQVVINDDRARPDENTDDLYPWKRWHVTNDPVGNNAKPPVEFFQPQSNSQEMLMIFKAIIDISDDVSAIPKYVGGQASGGAGRTASGLAMLMGNAAKILQTVAANIDRDIFEGALQQLADLIMLSDTTGILTGDEKIAIRGVNVAVQRETQRQRQLEFLQHTANPLDQQIMGLKGRGAVLRSVSHTIGLDGEAIVPSDEDLAKKEQVQNAQQPIGQQVQQGVAAGVKQGVQRITTELTAGLLAQQEQMPEGMGTHIGTLPGAPGGGTPPQQAAAQAQGSQPSKMSNSPSQQTNVVGNAPSTVPPGGRPAPIQGGPG